MVRLLFRMGFSGLSSRVSVAKYLSTNDFSSSSISLTSDSLASFAELEGEFCYRLVSIVSFLPEPVVSMIVTWLASFSLRI